MSPARASVRDVGLVEPPVVFPHPTNQSHYFVMDGHLRIEALKILGIAEVDCLVATDDDTYTMLKIRPYMLRSALPVSRVVARGRSAHTQRI